MTQLAGWRTVFQLKWWWTWHANPLLRPFPIGQWPVDVISDHWLINSVAGHQWILYYYYSSIWWSWNVSARKSWIRRTLLQRCVVFQSHSSEYGSPRTRPRANEAPLSHPLHWPQRIHLSAPFCSAITSSVSWATAGLEVGARGIFSF